MVNRYIGNTGRVQRIPEQTPTRREQQSPTEAFEQQHRADIHPVKKPPPNMHGGGLDRSVQRLLSRISPGNMEREDLILLLILYLLYRESGDLEFLITLAAFMLL